MSFRDRVICYLNKAAGDRSWKISILTVAAPITLFSAVVGVILLFYYLGIWARLPLIPLFLKYLVGPALLLFGSLAMLGSTWQFLRVRGTPVPLRPPPKLVTNGLYRLVRNPMFGGFFVFIIGLGFWLRSIPLGLLLVPLFVILLSRYLQAIEEPELEKRFGKEYVEYRDRTPRFFPRPPWFM